MLSNAMPNPPHHETVALLVDDERIVLDVMASIIGPHVDRLILMQDGSAAIAALSQLAVVTFVVSDHDLGHGPTGLDVLDHARVLFPDCTRTLISGVDHSATVGGGHTFVLKPFRHDTLLRALGLPVPA